MSEKWINMLIKIKKGVCSETGNELFYLFRRSVSNFQRNILKSQNIRPQVRFDLFQQVLIKMAVRLWPGLLQKLVLPGIGLHRF